jgi:hypothetical protein
MLAYTYCITRGFSETAAKWIDLENLDNSETPRETWRNLEKPGETWRIIWRYLER